LRKKREREREIGWYSSTSILFFILTLNQWSMRMNKPASQTPEKPYLFLLYPTILKFAPIHKMTTARLALINKVKL